MNVIRKQFGADDTLWLRERKFFYLFNTYNQHSQNSFVSNLYAYSFVKNKINIVCLRAYLRDSTFIFNISQFHIPTINIEKVQFITPLNYYKNFNL